MSELIRKITGTTSLSALVTALREFVEEVGKNSTKACMSLVEAVCGVIDGLERDAKNDSMYIVDEFSSSLFLVCS